MATRSHSLSPSPSDCDTVVFSSQVGVEAGGDGVETSKHAAPLTAGTPGVLHGALTYLLQVRGGVGS